MNRPESAVYTKSGQVGVLFYLFAALLLYGVLAMGMPVGQVLIVDRRHRDIFLLAAAVLGALAAFTAHPRAFRTPGDRVIVWSAIALPCYALFQLIPLPIGVLAVLSPVRAELVRALVPVLGPQRFAAISIVPAATFTHFLLMISYAAIFFATWNFSARARGNAWVVVFPVVLAAAIEAMIGAAQFLGADNQIVSGTYTIRNHFAGLMELALPFPAMYALSALRRAAPRRYMDSQTTLRIALGALLTALLAAGALWSLSRGGIAAILASVAVMAAVGVNWNMPLGRRLAWAGLFFLLAAASLYFLTPLSLVARLSEHTTAGRISVWREGLGILAQYPLVGCGLGGFESAFLRFKVVEGMMLVDYAHSDYLQFLAELGIAGFLIGVVLFGSVARRAFRAAAGHNTEPTSEPASEPASEPTSEPASEPRDVRWLGLACVGALTAIGVHSAVDFNLYVPANAAVLAWICGLTAGLGFRPG